MCGAYFCMGGYKRNGVAEIKMGAYIHQVLFFCGCLLSWFYSNYSVHFLGAQMHCMFTQILSTLARCSSHAYRQVHSNDCYNLCTVGDLCVDLSHFVNAVHGTLIWHPLYLSFQLTTCSHQNSSFAMLCAVFQEFKYMNLSNILQLLIKPTPIF